MMSLFLPLVLLFLLFFLLGKAADFVVDALRFFGRRLGISTMLLGIVLGIFTNLPEFAVGIDSIGRGEPSLAVGDLLGGVFVLFGIVLALSLALAGKVPTDGKLRSILPILVYSFLPVILFAIDGSLSALDGVILVVGYVIAIVSLARAGDITYHPSGRPSGRKLHHELLLLLIGACAIAIIAHYIVSLTVLLLAALAVPAFLVGLIVFSIGTNLPELAIAIEAWRRGAKSLSLANLLGSAMGQAFILGLLALVQPLPVMRDASFMIIFIMKAILFIAIALFYRSGRAFSRREGAALFTIYVIFIFLQIVAPVIAHTR